MKETLYFSVDQNVEVTEEEIWLGKIAALWCRDKTSLSKAMACRLGKMPGGKESFRVGGPAERSGENSGGKRG